MRVFHTKAGWVKSLPTGNIGPFPTKAEAKKAYPGNREKYDEIIKKQKAEAKKLEKVEKDKAKAGEDNKAKKIAESLKKEVKKEEAPKPASK